MSGAVHPLHLSSRSKKIGLSLEAFVQAASRLRPIMSYSSEYVNIGLKVFSDIFPDGGVLLVKLEFILSYHVLPS